MIQYIQTNGKHFKTITSDDTGLLLIDFLL